MNHYGKGKRKSNETPHQYQLTYNLNLSFARSSVTIILFITFKRKMVKIMQAQISLQKLGGGGESVLLQKKQ